METVSITIATMKIAVAKLAGIKTLSLLSFLGGVENIATCVRAAYVSR